MKNPETDQRTSTLGSKGEGLSIENAAYQHGKAFKSICGKCGATREDNQIGLEATPEAYVAQLVEVFRLVRRALKDDGTLWLSLGDSYAGSWGNQGRKPERGTQRPINGGMLSQVHDGRYPSDGSNTGACPPGLKPKDLVGIPWRVAFALQADGWYLRSDIIWSKPAPMPESVTDRPTKSHEYIFLLSKNPSYFYDADSIAEPTASLDPSHSSFRPSAELIAQRGRTEFVGKHEMSARTYKPTRNKRSVWHIATQPYPDAHFATYPEKLIEPCILAGSKVGDLVLDPFTGSGTTGAVAVRHQRNFIGCELNQAYVALARKRIGAVAPLFAEEATA